MNRVFAYILAVIALTPLSSRADESPRSYPVPTVREARLRAALKEDEPLAAPRPLRECLADMGQRHGIQIKPDEQALSEEGVSLDALAGVSPIDGAPNRVSLRSALRLALRDLDLTYVIRDGYVLVTTKGEAESDETCRVYPVGDLTLHGEFSGTAIDPRRMPGPRDHDYTSLIDLITTVVAPTTWDDVGGPSEVQAVDAAQALVIPQMAEVHEEIEEVLTALRAVRDRQRAAAVRRPEEVEPANEDSDGWPIRIYRLLPGWYSRATLGGRGMMGGGMGRMNAADDTHVSGLVRLAEPPTEAARPVSVGSATVLGQMGPFGTATSLAELAAEFEKLIAELAELLPEFIDPESWQAKGGRGVIRALPGALVVKQTPAGHERVGIFLAELLPNLAYVARFGDAGPPPQALLPTLDWPSEPEPRPGPREAAIRRALAATIDFEFDHVPLGELARSLSRTYQIIVLPDLKALEEESIALDLPITAHLRGVTLSEALRVTLKPLDMTFLVRDEALLLTTTAEAEALLTTKVYPVYDLVYAEPAKVRAGRARQGADYHALINTLTLGSPNTWDNLGGPGSIKECATCGALAISQTDEGHEQVERLLAALREARRVAKAKDRD